MPRVDEIFSITNKIWMVTKVYNDTITLKSLSYTTGVIENTVQFCEKIKSIDKKYV